MEDETVSDKEAVTETAAETGKQVCSGVSARVTKEFAAGPWKEEECLETRKTREKREHEKDP